MDLYASQHSACTCSDVHCPRVVCPAFLLLYLPSVHSCLLRFMGSAVESLAQAPRMLPLENGRQLQHRML